ncbi:MAG: hypothetical protein EBR30_21635 [Cytophagia bacterium]|nr:hypothetical protein [Cytophagia bacterium]
MGTSLNGLTPANTYQALIKVGNNTNLNTTLKTLSDGAGNDLPMQASTTAINFTGTVSGVASGVSGAIQFSNGSAFASDATNLFWDDTNNRLGVGTNAPINNLTVIDSTSGSTSGAIGITVGNSNTANALRFGSYFNIGVISGPSGPLMLQTPASNKGVSISTGYLIPTAMAHIQGSGSTSATTSLLVQNSGGTDLFKVQDNGVTTISSVLSVISYISTGDYITTNGIVIGNGNSRLYAFNGANANLSINNTGIVASTSGYSSSTASAVLEANSTTQGFLPPRMTTTQKNAIASPAEGLQIYDSTAKSPAYYDGTNWGYTGGALQNAAGNSGTLNISFAAGNIVNLTLNANTTLAFSNAVIGTYIIQVTQGATGANVLTYPASVKWAGGTAPTLTTTVGKTDILTFYYDGTNYYGNYSLNY